jgi:hypothetical protein
MSKYDPILPTAYGQAMIAKSFTDKSPLIFTKMALGDGVLSDGENFTEFTDLKNKIIDLPINEFDGSVSSQATIVATIDNSEVETGFFARELGVYAKVGEDGEEQLFGYTYAGNYADYTPNKDSTLDEKRIAVTLAIGNASTVEATINSAQYATVQNLNDHNTADDAHENRFSLFEKIENLADDIIKKLALTTTISVITALTTDSWFGQLLKMVLTASGVKYLAAQNGYLCLGSFLGGIIIQWGNPTAHDYTLPVAFTSFYVATANDVGAANAAIRVEKTSNSVITFTAKNHEGTIYDSPTVFFIAVGL